MNWNITIVCQIEAASKDAAQARIQDLLQDVNWFEIDTVESDSAPGAPLL